MRGGASARRTEAVTGPGTTVGTTTYMSPEQARGETVDARSDSMPAGKSLPDLPASGIDFAEAVVKLPGAQMIEHDPLSPGRDPSTYVFTKTDLQRNLFRVPLH